MFGGGWRSAHALPFRRRTDLTQNPIVNPVLVPPFLGIDLVAGNQHAEMHVIPESHARRAADSDLLLFGYPVAHFHANLAHVTIEAFERIAVIDDHAISVNS